MKIILEQGDKTIVLIETEGDEEIFLDDITKIDYSNLYGEATTISALLNKVGMWKANCEKEAKEAKLNCDVYVSELKRKYRREAATNEGRVRVDGESFKLTEKGLDEIIQLDTEYQDLQLELIELECKRDKLDTLFWAINSKDKKLNNILPKVTPNEFVQELVEGKVNTYMIRKPSL